MSDDDDVVEAIIGAGTLRQYVNTLQSVSSESRLHFGDAGVSAKIVDPANVAMTLADLSVEAFEAFDSISNLTIGVDLARIDEVLSVADSDDLVRLSIDMESRKCHLECGHIDQTIRLIDPQAIRADPDHPDLDLPNTVVIEARELDTVYKVSDMVANHLEIQGHPDAEEVRMVAQGDIEDSTVTFGHDEVIDASVTEAVASLYSLDYIKDLSKPIPAATEVEIRFGSEFPTIWAWEAADGNLTTTQMIAPRIRSS